MPFSMRRGAAIKRTSYRLRRFACSAAPSKSRLSYMNTPLATRANVWRLMTRGRPDGETSFGPSDPMNDTPRSFRKCRDVRVVAGEIRSPSATGRFARPALPASGVEQDDVARRDLHTLDLFERLDIRPMHCRARLEPTLTGALSRQERGIEQDAARDNPVLQGVDAASRTPASRLDIVHRHAVVSPAVQHDVTVDGIQVAVRNAVIGAVVLVAIQCDGRTEGDEGALEDRGSVGGLFLRHVVREGHRDALSCQRQRLLSFGRGNEIRCAQLDPFSPYRPQLDSSFIARWKSASVAIVGPLPWPA